MAECSLMSRVDFRRWRLRAQCLHLRHIEAPLAFTNPCASKLNYRFDEMSYVRSSLTNQHEIAGKEIPGVVTLIVFQGWHKNKRTRDGFLILCASLTCLECRFEDIWIKTLRPKKAGMAHIFWGEANSGFQGMTESSPEGRTLVGRKVDLHRRFQHKSVASKTEMGDCHSCLGIREVWWIRHGCHPIPGADAARSV